MIKVISSYAVISVGVGITVTNISKVGLVESSEGVTNRYVRLEADKAPFPLSAVQACKIIYLLCLDQSF